MHFKSTKYPPKIGHTKKPLRITQNHLKSTLKKLTKYLVFKDSKMAFYFWTKPFGACKKKEKTTPSQEGTRIFGALKNKTKS
jgi:hypothetical protein